MQNKNIALLALAVSGGGAFLTLPATDAAGKLIHHGFVAATIGGLADWYAVTALFRKPLGIIGYRTQILRRNRQRIMEAIVTFAADDMLNPQNIMARLEQENTAALFKNYLAQRGGREKIKSAIIEVMLTLAGSVDPRKAAAILAPTVRNGLDNFGGQKLFHAALDLFAEPKYSRPLLLSLLRLGRETLSSPTMQRFLQENIRQFRLNYERDSTARTLILSALDLSDERILALLNEKTNSYLTAAMAGQGEAANKLQEIWETFLADLKENASAEEAVAEWQKAYFAKLDITAPLIRWLEANLRGKAPFWLAPLQDFIDTKIDEFTVNKAWQENFDRGVKNFLAAEIAKHHDSIKKLIWERLNDLTDDELTDFVESKVADDLQMIRINGSVVGGLAGMAIYATACLLERLCGL